MLAHADHPIAAPLHDASVERLLTRALRRGDERVLDLGCAEGAWLIRAATERPGVRGDGVDLSAPALKRGRARVEAAGLAGRVRLHQADAATYSDPQPYDLVMCVGSTHALGGLLPALDAAARHLAPGGTLMIGDGFWEREPGEEILAAGFTPDEYTDLPTTIDRIEAKGWVTAYAHTSTRAEWDDYEWSWTGTLARWALEHPEDPDSGEALRTARRHRDEWLRGYRDTLGFVTLLLQRDGTAPEYK